MVQECSVFRCFSVISDFGSRFTSRDTSSGLEIHGRSGCRVEVQGTGT